MSTGKTSFEVEGWDEKAAEQLYEAINKADAASSKTRNMAHPTHLHVPNSSQYTAVSSSAQVQEPIRAVELKPISPMSGLDVEGLKKKIEYGVKARKKGKVAEFHDSILSRMGNHADRLASERYEWSSNAQAAYEQIRTYVGSSDSLGELSIHKAVEAIPNAVLGREEIAMDTLYAIGSGALCYNAETKHMELKYRVNVFNPEDPELAIGSQRAVRIANIPVRTPPVQKKFITTIYHSRTAIGLNIEDISKLTKEKVYADRTNYLPFNITVSIDPKFKNFSQSKK